MEYKEIADLVVRELMERGLQQQRQEDQQLDSLIKRHVALHEQLEQCVSSLVETSKQLFRTITKSSWRSTAVRKNTCTFRVPRTASCF